jgi:ribonuclease T2
MIAVQCGGSGNRLREVRICFSKSGTFRACGPNENQRRLCSADRMYVPPVRASAASKDPEAPSGPPREIVPLPK